MMKNKVNFNKTFNNRSNHNVVSKMIHLIRPLKQTINGTYSWKRKSDVYFNFEKAKVQPVLLEFNAILYCNI